MSEPSERPVLGRPPVEGSEEELDAWVESFLDAILGPEEGSGAHIRSTGETDEHSGQRP